MHLTPHPQFSHTGYFGVWAIVFAESGLFEVFSLETAYCSKLDFWRITVKTYIQVRSLSTLPSGDIGYATDTDLDDVYFKKKKDSWLFHKTFNYIEVL